MFAPFVVLYALMVTAFRIENTEKHCYCSILLQSNFYFKKSII